MSKKNKLPIKWMLGIIIILVAVAIQQTHSKNQGILTHSSSNASSPRNFFEFLANMIGIHSQNSSSGQASKENNIPNQNSPISGQTGDVNAGDQENLNSPSADNGSTAQGSNGAQQNNNAGNNPAINSENSSESNTKNVDSNSEFNTENNSEDNSEFNGENNSELNAESNSEVNAENNQENNSGNNSEINPNNPADNSETNAESNSENNSGSNSGSNPGSNSGDNSGNNSGDNSGDNSGNNSGSNSGIFGQNNLPTINPIPSDDQVSQSIAHQNQQSNDLAGLLAARQALVVPVQQQAQASKYQTVNSQNIPAANSSPPTADLVAKIKSNQITVTH